MFDFSRSERNCVLLIIFLALLVTGSSYTKKISAPYNTVSSAVDERPALIDINRAGEAEFIKLPGIGMVLARDIIAYRDSAGGFGSIEELKRIKGIGDKKFEILKGLVMVNE